MKWWGKWLVMGAIALTAFTITLSFMPMSGEAQSHTIFCSVFVTVLMWMLLLLFYLDTTSKLKKELDGLIITGEHIKARINSSEEDRIDKYEAQVQKWDESIDKILKDTEYENLWLFSTGFVKPEDESKSKGLEKFPIIYRNYMALRLTKLVEIRNRL